LKTRERGRRRTGWTATWLAISLLVASGCSEEADPDDKADTTAGPDFGDIGPLADSQSPPADATKDTGASSVDIAGDPDAMGPDVPGQPDQATGPTVSVELVHEGAKTLKLATSTTFAVLLQGSNGDKSAPGDDAAPQVLIDGAEVGSKGWVADPKAKQPAVALWPDDKAGTWHVMAIRPGKASVQLRYEGVTSNALVFEGSWPDKPDIRVTVPGATGSTDAEREIDLPDTIKLGGETIGAGGLDVTIRFPATAKAGDRFDPQVKPSKGGLSIGAELADVPGAKLVLAKGAMWIDQVDDGLFRGSFHGLAANLQPIAGAFVVERKGLFGVDVLGGATQVGKSDSLLPESGNHHSRATVHAVPGGKAMLIHRIIENKTKARLVRLLIDPISGTVDKTLPPLVDNANAYNGTPDVFAPAFGRVASAISEGKQLFVWEGRDGKGSKKPHQLWGQIYDDKYAATGPAVLLSDDNCNGNCKPEVHALPASRFLVVWSGPKGGVRARRVSGNLVDGKPTLLSPDAESLTTSGDGVTAATWEGNALIGWRDPKQGPVWRMYAYSTADDKLKAALSATPFGAKAIASPPPALLAVETPSALPNLLFAGAWLEGTPPGGLQIRRIAIDGTALGVDLPLGSSTADLVLGAVGKLGQVALLERIEAAAQGTSNLSLRVRKSRYQSLSDGGETLGAVVDLAPATNGWLAVPSLCYVPEVDAYVVAWSGDHASEGVWFRRFR